MGRRMTTSLAAATVTCAAAGCCCCWLTHLGHSWVTHRWVSERARSKPQTLSVGRLEPLPSGVDSHVGVARVNVAASSQPAVKASTAGIARSGQVSPVIGYRICERRAGRHALCFVDLGSSIRRVRRTCTRFDINAADVVICGSATAVQPGGPGPVLVVLVVLSTLSPPTHPTSEPISTSAAPALLSATCGNISFRFRHRTFGTEMDVGKATEELIRASRDDHICVRPHVDRKQTSPVPLHYLLAERATCIWSPSACDLVSRPQAPN